MKGRLLVHLIQCKSIKEEGTGENTGGEGKSALIFCSGVQLTRKNNDLRLVSKTCRTIPGELGWQEKYSFVVCPGKKNQRYQCRHVNTWNNMKRANSFEL